MTSGAAGERGAAPDALREEFDRRKAAIQAIPDLESAVREAGKLVTESGEFRGEAARLRTDLAEQWRKTEGLTLQQLADRLGVGLPTVQKLLEREKRARRRRERS